MGRSDVSLLGLGALLNIPSHAECPRKCRVIRILCRSEYRRPDHDFLSRPWSVSLSLGQADNLTNAPIETKQLTLEELDYVFNIPTAHHARYQARVFLPYWVKRYILFKEVQLESLRNFD